MSTTITKQPLKFVEIPLNKFSEDVIPHHQKIFDQHRTTVLKLISQNKIQLAQQECKNKNRSVKQLKDLMYELDTLRTQIEDSDLDKFDERTLSLRKNILTLVTGYRDLEKKSNALVEAEHQENHDQSSHPFEGAAQLQMHENVEDVKLKQRQDLLNEVETIQRDTEDLHEIFSRLNQMVDHQAENVDHVEESVESTHSNVKSGLQQLVKAHKIKAAAYPLTGAFIGTIIGGPIGLVAGLKVGGLAALGCALAGYTGGRFFKKAHENSDNVDETIDQQEKKDI